MIEARMKIDRDFRIGEIDDRIYGLFIEHLGRAVYEGLYEPNHPSADDMGFRTDVMCLARRLGLTIMRYPGGNFLSSYNWEDGVGPKEQHPRRLEAVWDVIETNQLGTNEFREWCRRIGAEVMMTVVGSSYWEMPNFPEWNETVLDYTYENVHYISIHGYLKKFADGSAEYLARPIVMDNFIRDIVNICDYVKAKRKSKKTMYVSFDEYNVWWREQVPPKDLGDFHDTPQYYLEEVYSFEDAVVMGTVDLTSGSPVIISDRIDKLQ